MNRIAVTSSNIAAIGYSASERVLHVEFIGGRIYEYEGVPETMYTAFMGADSPGKFFAKNIRAGGFVSRQVA